MQTLEIELKFMIPPASADALDHHPLLQAAASTERRMLAATYFDTRAQAFRAAKFSCRIRDNGARRILTVKGPTGDVTVRREWEVEASGETPDLASAPLPRALRKASLDAALDPVFNVKVERRSWILSQGASLIEAAFDRGAITADGRSTPVCEFELELKAGDPHDLYALARRLAADLPLYVDLRSKAQRGWALKDAADDIALTPDPAVTKHATFYEGFIILAQACLEPLAAHVPLLLATQSPEDLHRTRTAVRRMRALLRVFRRCVRDDAYDDLRGELKWLSRILGAARDLDVAGERLDLAGALEARRAKAYGCVIEALDSPRCRLMLIDLVAWLSGGDWRMRKPLKQTRGTFADVAALEIHRWDRRLRKDAKSLRDLDPEARHDIRVRAKSLAYVAELTTGLTERATRKDHAAYVKALKAFQSALGAQNDARVSEALIEDLATEADAKILRRAARRNARDADKLETKARKALERFLDAPRPFEPRLESRSLA